MLGYWIDTIDFDNAGNSGRLFLYNDEGGYTMCP